MNLASLVPAGTSVPRHINRQYLHNRPRTNKGSGSARHTAHTAGERCYQIFFNSRQQRLKKGCVQFSRWRGEATRLDRYSIAELAFPDKEPACLPNFAGRVGEADSGQRWTARSSHAPAGYARVGAATHKSMKEGRQRCVRCGVAFASRWPVVDPIGESRWQQSDRERE
jgi:hypothetical protein